MHHLSIATLMLPALLLVAPHADGDKPQAESTEPPPGFRERKRGKHVVYCRREEPKGSRFPSETCYDEQGIRDMLQSQREDQIKIDQIRRTEATTRGCC